MESSHGRRITALVFGLLLALPLGARAIGQITDPIHLTNALREKTYDETLTVVNTDSSASLLQLGAEGDIAQWVSFYRSAPAAESISELEVPAKTSLNLIARFTVPRGTPNGKYQGVVSVSKQMADLESSSEESGNSVSQRIDREVTIEVRDQEEVVFDVSLIPEKFDLVPGELLKIGVIYDNRSNIAISPQIHMKIMQGEDTLYSAIFPYPENAAPVGPNSLFEIPALEIPTSNLGNGKYEALFTLSQGDSYALDKDFTFSLGLVKSAVASANNLPDAKGGWPLLKIGSLLLISSALYLLANPRIRLFRRKTRLK